VFFQNLRMGGMYPVINDRLVKVLSAKGYPVLIVAQDQLDQVNKTPAEIMKEIQGLPGYAKSSIILVRFKVPSTEIQDKHEAEKYRLLPHRIRVLELFDEKGIPLVMVDPTKKKISIAHRYVAQNLSRMELFNPKGVFTGTFIEKLAGDRYYGLDDIAQLLIAETTNAQAGEYFVEFADQVADELAKDVQFWQGLQEPTSGPQAYTMPLVDLDRLMQIGKDDKAMLLKSPEWLNGFYA